VITERTRVPPRYRLIEEVGQGGMAIVYRAHDESLKREVAVKVLHPHLSAEPESKARLAREAQAVAKLKHDNILEIFDYSDGGAESAFIVTEFIDGTTLKQFLGSGPIKHPEIAALIAAEIGGALVHAHGMGIIHRDIKPENVMIRKDGLLKLMDFGIAQVLDLERMTVTGQLLGSPAYMAPELLEGRPLDVRTDVFSVGILLYQAATGTLPFSGKNPHEILKRITEGRFADPRALNRLCGAGLARIVARALARNPAERYPTMQALVTDLRENLSDAGLGEPRDELRQFFANAVAYEKALPDRMTPALTMTAQRNLSARLTVRAIECWNRVLAYAPNDQIVLAALKKLEGRARLRLVARYGLGAAGAVAVVAAIVVGLIHAASKAPATAVTYSSNTFATENAEGAPVMSSRMPTPSPLPTKIEPNDGQPSVGTPSHVGRTRLAPVVVRTEPAAHADPVEPAAVAAVPTPESAPRTFGLGPTPQNVDVFLDGERQFSFDTDHRKLTVPWTSNHVVEFRSPSGCCFVERVEIGPDRPLPTDDIIARKLKWKPARLIVTTEPSSSKTRIMVRDPAHAGRTVVAPGEEANVPFFSTDEGQKEIEVSIDSSAGFASERVVVRAGERKAIVVTLGTAP
jgi:tRNA A-37 threonylcarbamoyl transferase component Bud32